MADPFMSKVPRSKRMLKMLEVVERGQRRTINEDICRGLVVNKDLASLQHMRRPLPKLAAGRALEHLKALSYAGRWAT